MFTEKTKLALRFGRTQEKSSRRLAFCIGFIIVRDRATSSRYYDSARTCNSEVCNLF